MQTTVHSLPAEAFPFASAIVITSTASRLQLHWYHTSATEMSTCKQCSTERSSAVKEGVQPADSGGSVIQGEQRCSEAAS